ncbi:MAG: biotin-dependent carboxyltransferase family protein [Armatimonadetes bacterium]|nr:biotin-dependent carboxyltransferase family protein [Armatimonadota bacterium]
MGTVKVIDGGALTTIQDLGRFGYQSYGVPQSGAMDSFAFSLGNIALGNPENTPGLECTVSGPVLEMQSDEILCITGGDMGATVNGDPCPMWRTVHVKKGSVLSFQGLKSGCRTYICFRGGIRCPFVLGSASTFLKASMGGLDGRELRSGDFLFIEGGPAGYKEVAVPHAVRAGIVNSPEIRVLMGPQDDLFSAGAVATFLGSQYQVGVQADRMGYRLSGPAVKCGDTLSVFSQGTPLGGIQIDGEGVPIVLLRDRQTVGGYPVIATVISVDVDLFAQLKPGDMVRFAPVSLQEAATLYKERLRVKNEFREATRCVWGE